MPFVNALVAFSACQKIVPYAGHERQTVVGIAMLRAPSSVLRAAASKTDREPERERDSQTENGWVGELSSKSERKRVKERESESAHRGQRRERAAGRQVCSEQGSAWTGWLGECADAAGNSRHRQHIGFVKFVGCCPDTHRAQLTNSS